MARLPLPVRIDRPGLTLRQAEVEDAAALARAVTESLDHLRPWMSWATPEAGTEEAQRTRITGQRAAPTPEEYGFLLVGDDGAILGSAGLMTRQGRGALELGYWIHVDHVGRGLCTAAAAALTEVGLTVPGIERVEIHCDEANTASARIPEKLGYVLDRVVDRDVQAPGESGREMVWIRPAPAPAPR